MQKNTIQNELQKKLSELETTLAAKPVFLRDPHDNSSKLHVVSSKKTDAELEVPRVYTEVIGWHAGREVVRVKRLPHT